MYRSGTQEGQVIKFQGRPDGDFEKMFSQLSNNLNTLKLLPLLEQENSSSTDTLMSLCSVNILQGYIWKRGIVFSPGFREEV